MAILDDIANCPREVQPNSMQEKTCKFNFKDVTRLVIIDQDGTDPFTASQTTFAGVTTQVETQSIWDTSIGLSTTSKLTLTPKASNFQMPLVKVEPVQLPDQTFEMPQSFPSQRATMSFDGILSVDHRDLMLMSGTGRSILFVTFDGQVWGRSLTDVQVEAGESIFFVSETFIVSTRQVQTGASELDMVDVDLSFKYDELVEFQLFNTSAFGRSI